MDSIARYAIIAGLVLIIIGVLLFGASKLNLPLGRLPGDIRIEGEHGSFYFPLATSIVLSILLTIVLNVIVRLFKK
jgi:hypothetical protein